MRGCGNSHIGPLQIYVAFNFNGCANPWLKSAFQSCGSYTKNWLLSVVTPAHFGFALSVATLAFLYDRESLGSSFLLMLRHFLPLWSLVNRVLLVEHRQRTDSNAGVTCSTKLWHGGFSVGHNTFLVYSQKRGPMLGHGVLAVGHDTELRFPRFWYFMKSFTFPSLPFATLALLVPDVDPVRYCDFLVCSQSDHFIFDVQDDTVSVWSRETLLDHSVLSDFS